MILEKQAPEGRYREKINDKKEVIEMAKKRYQQSGRDRKNYDEPASRRNIPTREEILQEEEILDAAFYSIDEWFSGINPKKASLLNEVEIINRLSKSKIEVTYQQATAVKTRICQHYQLFDPIQNPWDEGDKQTDNRTDEDYANMATIDPDAKKQNPWSFIAVPGAPAEEKKEEQEPIFKVLEAEDPDLNKENSDEAPEPIQEIEATPIYQPRKLSLFQRICAKFAIFIDYCIAFLSYYAIASGLAFISGVALSTIVSTLFIGSLLITFTGFLAITHHW